MTRFVPKSLAVLALILSASGALAQAAPPSAYLTPIGPSIGVEAAKKAAAAALFKRPSKAFQDAVAGGGVGVRILGLEGAVPLEGGLPIVVGGKLVGAIDLSGDLSENDGKCAAAGVAALKE